MSEPLGTSHCQLQFQKMLSETWYISWGNSIPVFYLLLHTVFEGAWKFSRLVCPTLISKSWNFIHILTDPWIGKRENEEVGGDVFFWLLWIVLALTGVSLFSSESQKGPKPFLQQRKEGVVLPELGCWLTLSLCGGPCLWQPDAAPPTSCPHRDRVSDGQGEEACVGRKPWAS